MSYLLNEPLPFIVLGNSALPRGIFVIIDLSEMLGKKLMNTMVESLNLNRKTAEDAR